MLSNIHFQETCSLVELRVPLSQSEPRYNSSRTITAYKITYGSGRIVVVEKDEIYQVGESGINKQKICCKQLLTEERIATINLLIIAIRLPKLGFCKLKF